MHIRGVLLSGLIAIAGCSKDKEAAPRPEPAPRGSGSAKPEPEGLRLVSAPEAVAHPVTSKVAIVIAKDGSLSVAEIGGVFTGLTVADVKGGPVAQVADLAAAVTAMTPPPPVPSLDEESGGAGTAMALDEGKMGKKDSDRAEGSYKMKSNAQAREEAIAAARSSGILGAAIDPCEAGDGWGSIGVGSGYGMSGPVVSRAGLRGTSVKDAPICGAQIPLVLADAGAPAARVVEVMSALPESLLAITTDGSAHAQTLAVSFTFLAGNRAAELPEVGFTLSPDGARGSAYRGATEDPTTWTWDGKSGGIKEAFEATSSVDALRDLPVRIRLDGELTAGALIGAIATLVDGHAATVAIGEPIDHERAGAASTNGPGVRIGQPTLTGDLDKAIIRRYIKRNLQKIKYCYEKELLAAPALEGTVSTAWTIKANGTVADAKAVGVSPEVSSCVASVIGGIEFPKPKSGDVLVTSYPFTFRPSGG